MSLVSVVCVNLNGGKYLNKLISSLERQSIFKDIELVFVDGGSIDNSIEIVNKYTGNKKIINNENEINFVDSFRVGFEMSSSPYIIQICSDDYLLDYEYLEMAVNILHNGKSDLVFARSLDVDECGRPIRLMLPISIKPPKDNKNLRNFFAFMKFGGIPDGNIVCKKEIFLECFPKANSKNDCEILIPHATFFSNFLQTDFTMYFLDTIANCVTNRKDRRSMRDCEKVCIINYQKNNYRRHYEKELKLGLLNYFLAVIKINFMQLYYSQILSLSFREAFQKFCSKFGLKFH